MPVPMETAGVEKAREMRRYILTVIVAAAILFAIAAAGVGVQGRTLFATTILVVTRRRVPGSSGCEHALEGQHR